MNMRNLIIINILIIALFSTGICIGQSIEKFIVIDNQANNHEKLSKTFRKHKNVLKTNTIDTNVFAQMLLPLEYLQVEELHIYAETTPGKITFSNVSLTIDNINQYYKELENFSQSISKTIIIHSQDVFNDQVGQALKERMEDITGLIVSTEK